MTRVLIRLRYSLMANSLGSRVSRRMTVAISYAVSIALGLFCGGLLLLSRGAGENVPEQLVVFVPMVLFLGWLTGPLLTASLDSTVDPVKLAIYPLTRRQLAVGLFAVACLGGGGVFTAMVVAGLLGAVVPAGPVAVLLAAAALTFFGTCVIAARLIATLISSASRRVRDLLIFLGPLIFMVIGVGPSLLRFGQSSSTGPTGPTGPSGGEVAALLKPLRRFALALPSAPTSLSMESALSGHLLVSLVWLAAGVAVFVVLLWAWGLVLSRSLSNPPAPVTNRRAAAGGATAALYPKWAIRLPRSRWGAVAAKDLKLAIRDPRQRTQLVGAAVGAIPLAVVGLTESADSAVLRGAAVAFFIAANSANLYGFDASSHWMNVAAGDDAKADLTGKVVARAVFAGGLSAIVILGLAAASGRWGLAVPALCLAFAGLGLGLGPAAVVSVAYPSPIPPKQKNLFSGTSTGQGLVAFGPVIGITVVGGLTLLALGFLMAGYGLGSFGPVIASALAVFVGVVVGWGGFRRAVRRSAGQQPELLLALSKS